MSQSSTTKDTIGQSGNTEDRPWVFSPNTHLVVHQTCACCDNHSHHYREAGMCANSMSFRAARQAEKGKIREPLQSTLLEVEALHTSWETADRGLRQEIEQTKKELEAIKQESNTNAQEFERLSRELEKVRGETVSFRREGARLVDEARTPHAQPVHINILDSDSDSEIEIISPPS